MQAEALLQSKSSRSHINCPMNILILLILPCISLSASKLLMIQEIFRHGARTPYFPNTKDGSFLPEFDPSEPTLTNQGKYMHYQLGKIIHSTYWFELFGDSQFKHSDISVMSTGKNRTMQSASSHLYGMLQGIAPLTLTAKQAKSSSPAWQNLDLDQQGDQISVFSPNSHFQPIPIHIEYGGKYFQPTDFLTLNDQDSCPNQARWKQEKWNSPIGLYIQSHTRVIAASNELSEVLGQQVAVRDVYKWKDSQECLKSLNLPYLPVFDKHSQIFDFLLSAAIYMNQVPVVRPITSQLVRKTSLNLQKKAGGDLAPRIIVYSAHDSTIGMMLSALNLTSIECIVDHYLRDAQNQQQCIFETPTFSANLIFELWENKGAHYIKVKYNGKLKRLPICGNKYQCPLQEFVDWADSFIMADWEVQCGRSKASRAMLVVGAVVVIGAIGVVRWRRGEGSSVESWGSPGVEDQQVI